MLRIRSAAVLHAAVCIGGSEELHADASEREEIE